MENTKLNQEPNSIDILNKLIELDLPYDFELNLKLNSKNEKFETKQVKFVISKILINDIKNHTGLEPIYLFSRILNDSLKQLFKSVNELEYYKLFEPKHYNWLHNPENPNNILNKK